MANYEQVAVRIQRLIRERQLRPGTPLPSERELVKLLRAPYGTIRLANDRLCRDSVIERVHGRGTFVARPKAAAKRDGARRRLGLLVVDVPLPSEAMYSQTLILALQRFASQAGYELVVEGLQTDDLVRGQVPDLIRRRSVDGLLLDGRVRSHHIKFLEEHGLPYLVTGNCPLDRRVPQIRWNVAKFAYEVARELFRAGRHPVWFDSDITSLGIYQTGLEVVQGYEAAVHEFSTHDPSLYLCHINLSTIMRVAPLLQRGGLEHAAIVTTSWRDAFLPSATPETQAQNGGLLVVPWPDELVARNVTGANVLQWSRLNVPDDTAARAVNALTDVLDGKTNELQSLTLEMTCHPLQPGPPPRMDIALSWTPTAAFTLDTLGHGKSWRFVELTPANAAKETA